jgi:hypothetical protein
VANLIQQFSYVDGLSQSEETACQFARKYEDLYSCETYDANEMACLQLNIYDKIEAIAVITTLHDESYAKFNRNSLKNCVESGKHDGYLGCFQITFRFSWSAVSMVLLPKVLHSRKGSKPKLPNMHVFI